MNKILSTLFLALSVLMPLNLWAQGTQEIIMSDGFAEGGLGWKVRNDNVILDANASAAGPRILHDQTGFTSDVLYLCSRGTNGGHCVAWYGVADKKLTLQSGSYHLTFNAASFDSELPVLKVQVLPVNAVSLTATDEYLADVQPLVEESKTLVTNFKSSIDATLFDVVIPITDEGDYVLRFETSDSIGSTATWGDACVIGNVQITGEGTSSSVEPYAVLTTDTTLILNQSVTGVTYGQTLTFYYDDQKVARNGMDIGPFAYLEHGFGESQRPWHDVRESITDVVFDSSMANDTTLISTGWWFYGCTNLKRTSGWQYLPTANIVDMWGMFENCSSLSSNPVEGGPDFSAFNTASLKRTCYLFHGCTSMTSIDLSTFNTANVTETEGMFKDCAALTTIYVGSGWTMTNVSGNWEDDMFSGSTSLVGGAGTTYDASNIGVSYAHIDGGPDNPGYLTSNGDTPYVVASEAYAVLSDDDVVLSQSATNITYGKKLTFYYDNQKSARNGMSVDFTDSMLREWNSSSSMITSVVFDSSFANDTTLTSTAWWFYNLDNLTTVTGIENLNTNHVTNMYSMFAYCPKLTSLDVSGFNTSKVTDMGYMFGGCSGLTTLNVSGFNTSNVTNMRNMFDSCSGLTSLDVSNFNTANVTNMYGMFMNCSGLTTLDLSSFNTAKVEVMDNMFCQNSLTTIYVDGTKWNTGAVTSSISMFYMCPNLVGGKGTTYDANHVDASYAHIDGGMANPGYFTAKGGLADPLLARLYDNLALTTTDGNADGGNNDLSVSIDAAQTSLVRAMWNLQELPTDESYCVWMDPGIPALNTNTWSDSTQTQSMMGLYARLYHGIALANNYLANQNDGDMGKQAEARFLRALQYYYLMDHFGNVPLLTDTIDRQPLPVWEATPSDIELLTREEMFSYIENELQESLNSLPATNSYGRATATAARLLLARLYLNSEVYTGTARWQEARSYAESVINGGTFQLAPIYRNLFMGDNDSNGAQQEIILPAIYDGNTRTDYGGTTFLVASSFSNGEGDNGTTQVWAGNVSKPDFVNKFFTQTADIPYASPEQTASAAGDDRALFYGINHSYELRNGDSFSDGFPYQKFTNVRSNGTSPVSSKFADTDFPLMRLGEAYLIAAEADARLNGSTTSMQGTQYINMLRNRANATTSTAGYSLSDICDEWSREMGYEAVRRTTLIRFGRFGGQTDYSWAWKGGSYDGTAFDAGMNTYPIPAVEVGSTPEPYVVLTDSNTVMTFYYDDKKADRSGLSRDEVSAKVGVNRIVSVVFDETFAGYYPTSTRSWFNGYTSLANIENIEFLKTDSVTDMHDMFANCSSLTSLDLRSFNTDKVKDTDTMFSGCSKLTSLNLSSFNTSLVGSMGYMFSGCSSLTSLDLSNFDTSNVKWMGWMFQGCSSLRTLDLSSFNTSNVIDMGLMFSRCSNLTTIWVSETWAADGDEGAIMFELCEKLVGGAGTTYDADHIDATYAHIDGGEANPGYFTDKNAPAVNDTIDVVGNTDLSSAWWSAFSSNYEIPADYTLHMQFTNHSDKANNWDNWVMLCTADSTRTPEYFALRADRYGWGDYHNADGFTTNWEDWDAFREAMDGALVDFTVRRWGSEVKVTSISKATDGTELIQTYTTTVAPAESQSVNVFLTVENAYLEIYKNSISLTPSEAPVEPYAVLSADSLTVTFYYDDQKASRGGMEINNNYINLDQNSPYGSAATAIIDDSFAGYRPTSTAYWFASCSNLTAIEGMANLNTANVTDMGNMFQGCSGLTSLDVSGFNTANVTGMERMFYACSRLTSLDVSGFNTANVMGMYLMFCNCSSLTSLDVSSFNTANVTNMEGMFYNCSTLTSLDLSSFNTANVKSMSYMFSDCSGLTAIYVGEGWSTAAVTVGTGMFNGCTALVGGRGTAYDANHTDHTYAHIDGGTQNPGYLTLYLTMGDANGDGDVNIADAVATVTNILGQPTAEVFYQYAADMNNDKVIDIFDVTMIVNAAFEATSPAPAMTRGSADNIMMEHISMTADADYIYLGVDQPERFTATQFDVTLPEGMELVDARLASATTDHQLTFVKRGDNEYRVIGLSMSNTTFRSMNGQLIKLEVSGSAVDSDVKMSNVLFVTPTATVMTSIDKCLNTAKMADDSLYDLKGQRLSKQQLGKGIYIMNHKKVIIK